jgi:hypothetical protein
MGRPEEPQAGEACEVEEAGRARAPEWAGRRGRQTLAGLRSGLGGRRHWRVADEIEVEDEKDKLGQGEYEEEDKIRTRLMTTRMMKAGDVARMDDKRR